MANRKQLLGMLAVTLAFGLVLAGCPGTEDDGKNTGPGNDNARLVGKWKAQSDTNDPPRIVFEFLDSGMVVWDGNLVTYLYQGSSLQLSTVSGTAALSADGNTLYLSNFGAGTNGTYTRVGGSGETGGNSDAKSIKITGFPSNMETVNLILFDNSGNGVASGSFTGSIKSGEVTIALFDENSMNPVPWRGSGNYGVVIESSVKDGSIMCYLNGTSPNSIKGPGSLPKLGFNSALTTVEYSKFGMVPLDSLFGH